MCLLSLHKYSGISDKKATISCSHCTIHTFGHNTDLVRNNSLTEGNLKHLLGKHRWVYEQGYRDMNLRIMEVLLPGGGFIVVVLYHTWLSSNSHTATNVITRMTKVDPMDRQPRAATYWSQQGTHLETSTWVVHNTPQTEPVEQLSELSLHQKSPNRPNEGIAGNRCWVCVIYRFYNSLKYSTKYIFLKTTDSKTLKK